MQRPALDPEVEAKIRAMALARRRLAREIKRISAMAGRLSPLDLVATEVDRLVLLSRWMLDSSRRSLSPLPAAQEPDARPPAAIPPSPTEEVAPTPEHKLVLRGHARWFLAPDLIAYLGSAKKSGVLRISTTSEVFTIEFLAGDIVHCESTRPYSSQRLGDILISQGALDRLTLETQLGAPSPLRLGARLLHRGIITKRQLDAALETQVQILFCRLCREEARNFTFWTGPPMFAEGGVRLSAISLILEGSRVNDEFADSLSWLEERQAQETKGA